MTSCSAVRRAPFILVYDSTPSMAQLRAGSGSHALSGATDVNDDAEPKTSGVLGAATTSSCNPGTDSGCTSPFDPIAWGPSSTTLLPILGTSMAPMYDGALGVNDSVDGEYDVVGFSTKRLPLLEPPDPCAPLDTVYNCAAHAVDWRVNCSSSACCSGGVCLVDLHEVGVPALDCLDSSWAHAANNRDSEGRMQVVGKSAGEGAVRWSRDPSATNLWTKERLIDLVCPSQAAGWSLNRPYAITDNGIIVGRGHRGEAGYHAFLMISAVDPPCLGDLDDDGDVDSLDLAILLGEWGSCPSDAGCPADLNHDCTVDGLDLAILLGNWHCGYSSMAPTIPPTLEELVEALELLGLYDLADLLQSVWPQE